jgi:hypothetical protein
MTRDQKPTLEMLMALAVEQEEQASSPTDGVHLSSHYPILIRIRNLTRYPASFIFKHFICQVFCQLLLQLAESYSPDVADTGL